MSALKFNTKLYACIVIVGKDHRLFDIALGTDAQDALKVALRREVNKDARDWRKVGHELIAVTVLSEYGRERLAAAAKDHGVTPDALLADSVEYDLALEREKITRRYRRRTAELKHARAVQAPPKGELPKEVQGQPAGRLTVDDAGVDEEPATPVSVSVQRARVAKRVTVGADGAAHFNGHFIGHCRGLEHAVNRAFKLVREIKDAGGRVNGETVATLCLEKKYTSKA